MKQMGMIPVRPLQIHGSRCLNFRLTVSALLRYRDFSSLETEDPSLPYFKGGLCDHVNACPSRIVQPFAG